MLDDDAPAVAALIATVEASFEWTARQAFLSMQLPVVLWLAAATASSKALEVSCGACCTSCWPCHHAISLSDTSIQSPCLTCYTSLRLCVLPAPQELLLHSKGHNWTRANAYQTQVCRLLQPMLLRPQADTVCNSLLVLAQHFTDCSLPTAAAPGACLQPIAALALRAAGARGWPPVRETLEHVVRWYPTARTAM